MQEVSSSFDSHAHPTRVFKIAFVGSTNTFTLPYALRLKELGHVVAYYVDYPLSEQLHRPEFHYSNISYPYPDWIKEVKFLRISLEWLLPFGQISNFVSSLRQESYDAIILCGTWHKIAFRFPGKTKIYGFFHGSDLDVIASYRHCFKRALKRSFLIKLPSLIYFLIDTTLHRFGISKMSGINYYWKGLFLEGDILIDQIFANKPYYRFLTRGADCSTSTVVPTSNRTGSQVSIICATRFLWQKPFSGDFADFEYKGNDILLEGFSRFINRHHVGCRLTLFEKGPHVQEAKILSERLKIDHLIDWQKTVSKIVLQQMYLDADIIIDQLGSHIIGNAGIDGMLMGKPVIANVNPVSLIKSEMPPIFLCQASNPNEVAKWLARLVFSPALRKKIGIRSRLTIMNYHSASRTCQEILDDLCKS